jgi:hypothetical protein
MPHCPRGLGYLMQTCKFPRTYARLYSMRIDNPTCGMRNKGSMLCFVARFNMFVTEGSRT